MFLSCSFFLGNHSPLLARPEGGGAAMEHGSLTDSTSSTFSIMEEDHTLANSARFVLNQE
jgi:hypothetical protein